MNGERCSGAILRDYSTAYGHQQCSRRGNVVRDGKPYCTQHDPQRIEAKREARNARWEKKWAAEAEQREFTNGCESVCRAAGVTLDDLRQGRVRVTVIPCEAQL